MDDEVSAAGKRKRSPELRGQDAPPPPLGVEEEKGEGGGRRHSLPSPTSRAASVNDNVSPAEKRNRSPGLRSEEAPPPSPGVEEEDEEGGRRHSLPSPTSRAATTEDDVSVAKKRNRSPELRNQEVPPPSPGVEEEEGEAGGGLDLISLLPDGVLGDIISLLPTKEAARTRILASRWRHLWLSAPLNLECHGHPDACPAEILDLPEDAISRILSTHPGPGRRLRIPACHRHCPGTLDAWLMSPALNNLQELEFYSQEAAFDEGSPLPSLPASAFRFAATLRVAAFGHCHIPDGTGQPLHFPTLTHLALDDATISEGCLHAMLAGCPSLENLLLKCAAGFRRVQINSASLRTIWVSVSCHRPGPVFEELNIEHAPCLERLLRPEQQHWYKPPRILVISAPKLETLGCISDTCPTMLMLGSTVIHGLHVVDMTMVVRTVKILSLSYTTLSLNSVIRFLRCFPCLERLYIQSLFGGKNFWHRKKQDLIEGLDLCLKNIVMTGYRGIKAQRSFATFFILNARMLESIRFVVADEIHINGSWIVKECECLEVEKRVSIGAQFDFRKDRCQHKFMHANCIHDLSIADPFACRC